MESLKHLCSGPIEPVRGEHVPWNVAKNGRFSGPSPTETEMIRHSERAAQQQQQQQQDTRDLISTLSR